MKIYYRAEGVMRSLLPDEQYSLELEAPSTLEQFCQAFGEKEAWRLPNSIWDSAKGKFRGPVVIKSDGTRVSRMDVPLHDGVEITLCLYIIGG